MKSFDSATLALLASGRISKRDMILFELSVAGLFGFWSGLGTFTYQSVDYVGAGSLIQIDALGGQLGLAASAVTVKLSSVPNSDLTPDVLNSIEDYQWHQAPVVISRAYFNPTTSALVSVERMYRGYVDRIDHEEQVGGQKVLVGYLESKARDHLKRGYRMAGDSDQRRVDATDAGLSGVATAAIQTIYWGRVAEPVGGSAKR